jgi:hypothetical protein
LHTRWSPTGHTDGATLNEATAIFDFETRSPQNIRLLVDLGAGIIPNARRRPISARLAHTDVVSANNRRFLSRRELSAT